MTDHDIIEAWLRALTQALSAMPAEMRADIVDEARAHLEERLAAGLKAESALHGFGTAEVYARPFMDDFQVHTALQSKSSLSMIRALLNQTARSLVALLGLFVALVTGLLGLGSIAMIAQKIIAPDKVGLWIWHTAGQNFMCLGICDGHPHTPDMIGMWAYAVFVFIAALMWFICRLSLRLALKSLVRPKKMAST
ncbi:MAG: hypothetical protein WCA78_01955 [Rhizomicrobium sp.]